ncbi:MAG TPA: histidine phosphatase family protein [Thermomicrobiales bacterium]|nr:histidine phosphatase family protein [Thermomicrobiales bacterium]
MPEPNGHHPESTILTLVRHGETDWNAQRRMQGRTDIPLNERGRQQAELVARRLEGTSWDGIVSSPLIRVMDVSRAIARAIGYPEDAIVQRDDLVERSFGEAEGMTLAERTERFGLDGPIPGIETYDELDRRVMNALREIEAQYRAGRVLVVAHGGVINAALEQLAGEEHGHGKSFIANVSLTTIRVHQDEWVVDMINDYSHLLGTEFEPITAPVTGSGQASVKR